MMQRFHVFYRTIGMSSRREKGWARADVEAETVDQALGLVMRNHNNLIHARVYPARECASYEVRWHPQIEARHTPHPSEEEK